MNRIQCFICPYKLTSQVQPPHLFIKWKLPFSSSYRLLLSHFSCRWSSLVLSGTFFAAGLHGTSLCTPNLSYTDFHHPGSARLSLPHLSLSYHCRKISCPGTARGSPRYPSPITLLPLTPCCMGSSS